MKSAKSKSFPFTDLLNVSVEKKKSVATDGEVELYIFLKIQKWHKLEIFTREHSDKRCLLMVSLYLLM